MSHQVLGRVLTWLCVGALIVLSLVPGRDRPHTGLAGQEEHFIAYAGTGMIAMLSYRRSLWTIVGLSLLSSALETLQNFVPGRSPAVLDVIFSSAGATTGTGMAVLLSLAVSYSRLGGGGAVNPSGLSTRPAEKEKGETNDGKQKHYCLGHQRLPAPNDE